MQVVQGALHVEEKWIAAPAGEEAVVAGLRHPCLRPRRDRRSLDDDLPVVACPGGLRALNPAKRRGLRSVLGGRESHPVRDIGDGIAVRIDLQFINRLGREGVVAGRPGRVGADGRMRVHNQDRLAGIPRLGEGIEIGEVEAGVPVGEPKVGTGIMVRHGFSSVFG